MKSLLSLIVQNADFPAGTGSSAFSLLWDGGFVHLETCLEIMCPKEQLFGYLKVRHFLSSNLTSTSINLPTFSYLPIASQSGLSQSLNLGILLFHYSTPFSVPLMNMSCLILLISGKRIQAQNIQRMTGREHYKICPHMQQTERLSIRFFTDCISPLLFCTRSTALSLLCSLLIGEHIFIASGSKLISSLWSFISKEHSRIFKMKI